MILLFKTIDLIFQIYFILLFVRILVSWVPELHDKKWVQVVGSLTDPFLDLFRKVIPPIGMLDISPMFAFLALGLVQHLFRIFAASMLR